MITTLGASFGADGSGGHHGCESRYVLPIDPLKPVSLCGMVPPYDRPGLLLRVASGRPSSNANVPVNPCKWGRVGAAENIKPLKNLVKAGKSAGNNRLNRENNRENNRNRSKISRSIPSTLKNPSVVNAHEKTRRGFRPGFLHSFFRLPHLTSVAVQVNEFFQHEFFQQRISSRARSL
jgi:hypothetical protein